MYLRCDRFLLYCHFGSIQIKSHWWSSVFRDLVCAILGRSWLEWRVRISWCLRQCMDCAVWCCGWCPKFVRIDVCRFPGEGFGALVVTKANDARLSEQCNIAEELHVKHDDFHFHKKVKEITNTFRKIYISKITKNNHIAITDTQEICEYLGNYIQGLFEAQLRHQILQF